MTSLDDHFVSPLLIFVHLKSFLIVNKTIMAAEFIHFILVNERDIDDVFVH